jgi:glutathionylspermidine synthase
LWQKHQGHPNLLESHFEQPGQSFGAGWVRKPLFSREGANVELVTHSGEKISEPGPYADSPFIRQKLHPLPKFGDSYTMIGSWVVGNSAAGIGIREDNSLITKDSSRFLPHIILD